MSKHMKKLVLHNNQPENRKVEIDTFKCIQISIDTKSEWMKDVLAKAKKIEGKLNAGKANDSASERDAETVASDNNSGLIAENACYVFLQYIFGKEAVSKPSSESSKNQIDIELSGIKKTIEVRSSCIRNGVEFAVFAKDPNDNEHTQYFDVIGPYNNEYKPEEVLKDYYMRVIYHCNIKDFDALLQRDTLELYLTGGATKEMLEDSTLYEVKHLYPKDGEVEVESEYRVIPLSKSLDIDAFVGRIKHDISASS